jgi:hypothetical protein
VRILVDYYRESTAPRRDWRNAAARGLRCSPHAQPRQGRPTGPTRHSSNSAVATAGYSKYTTYAINCCRAGAYPRAMIPAPHRTEV